MEDNILKHRQCANFVHARCVCPLGTNRNYQHTRVLTPRRPRPRRAWCRITGSRVPAEVVVWLGLQPWWRPSRPCSVTARRATVAARLGLAPLPLYSGRLRCADRNGHRCAGRRRDCRLRRRRPAVAAASRSVGGRGFQGRGMAHRGCGGRRRAAAAAAFFAFSSA